jgi:hypothetical protein
MENLCDTLPPKKESSLIASIELGNGRTLDIRKGSINDPSIEKLKERIKELGLEGPFRPIL